MVMRRQAGEQPQCGSGRPDAYNTGLQVLGLFLILTLSALACSFPIAVKRFPRLPVPRHVLFVSKHFGTGVLLATAFCHLLPTAFQSLLNECLPDFWSEFYPAMAGLIAMLGAIVVVGIEMIFTTRSLKHTHQSDLTNPPTARDTLYVNDQGNSLQLQLRTVKRTDDEDDLAINALPTTTPAVNGAGADDLERQTSGSSKSSSEERLVLQCVLLEAGILFHSIFIGVAIAFSTGMAFVVLLIAISFHQIFEGLALGSRIAAINTFKAHSPKPWLMALAYGVTAPLGQAIGLGVHGSFSLESPAGLLMVGIFNAFSSGLLLYAGFVQLLAEDFLSEQSYVTLKGRSRVEACVAVLVGAFGMALIGAWA